LAEARAEATKLYQLHQQNPHYDPIEERKQQQIEACIVRNADKTFKVCAEEFISFKSEEWTNEKHKQQWHNTLKDYAYPVISNVPHISKRF